MIPVSLFKHSSSHAYVVLSVVCIAINTDLRTINNELKHIADKLSIGNQIECMKKREQPKMPTN